MNLGQLAWRNIKGNAFRSWVVFLCAMVVAGFSLSAVMIIRGAEDSLRLALNRLGADIIVVPEGAETKVETALLMGKPVKVWMPQENLDKIARIPGVAVASPQLYLSSLSNASCCSVAEMFMVAFDPKTDFTIEPWLKQKLGHELRLGEAVGGSNVFTPEGEENIKLYGYFITLKGNLTSTGTGLDQTMFLTFETAQDVARISKTRAERPLEIPANSISAALVKVQPGSDPQSVALDIMQKVPGVTPIESPNMFQTFRQQIMGLLRGMLLILSITLVLSLVLISLIFSMAANERRRELGVLRALGATRGFVFQSILAEAVMLAVDGGAVGIALACLATFLFRDLLVRSLGIPFLLPSLPSLITLIGGGLVLALSGVTLAALIPAFKISRQDPALAMRE
jgi:putative ABC transport system permease protein